MDRQLIELCGALRDETISRDDFALLERRLGAGPKARAFYLRFMQVHTLLEDLPPAAPALGAGARKTAAFPVRALATILAAAACIAAAFLLLLPKPAAAPTTYAGTLILSENCRWNGGPSLMEGERLATGLVHLLEGIAVIRFDGGAELTLSGNTRVDLQSPGSCHLLHGEVVVLAENGAEGFRLRTPASDVIDLGTEFAVRVEETGATEVHVHDGEVEYRNGGTGNPAPEVLKAGKAIRFDGTKSRPHAVPLNAPRFKEVIRKANPRPRGDLMFAYSGFNYEAGNLPLAESTRGKGWSSPWRLRLPDERSSPDVERTPGHLRITTGQMNVTWPLLGGRHGMLEMPAGGAFYVRNLARPVPMDGNRITFFSLMVKETERARGKSRPLEGIRLTFRSSVDYFGQTLSFGHGPNFRPRIQSSPDVLFTSPILFPKEETTLWIGKIVSRKNGEDEVYFRIYGEKDELDYAEPASWHVVTRNLDLDARFDRILLSSTGSNSRIVDELRIGPTWRSVAPIQPSSGYD